MRDVSPLLVDLREHDGAVGDGLPDLSEFALPMIGDAASNGAGEAGTAKKFMMLKCWRTRTCLVLISSKRAERMRTTWPARRLGGLQLEGEDF